MTQRDEAFRSAVLASAPVDPMPPLRVLAGAAGVEVDAIVHHALVRGSRAEPKR